MTLRAVVIGAGWAGEGHTKALLSCGVEVVAICARNAGVTQSVADRLGVPVASTDWRKTLETERPDIVSLATPAVLRSEVIEAAAGMGCHLYSDKPLATNAQEAKRLYQFVEQAGVKHAFAATHCYDPSFSWLRELIHNNTIGRLREIELIARLPQLTKYTPWAWMDTLAAGGGILNSGMPHMLGALERMLGAHVVRVTGSALVLRRQAPVVPGLHDFRLRGALTPTVEEAERLEWRTCDAENAFSAMLQFAAPAPDVPGVQVYCLLNMMADAAAPTNGWYFYGERGMLKAEGLVPVAVFRYDQAAKEYEPLPLPPRLVTELPQVGTIHENKWSALAREFVADIRDQAHQPYLTFRDGWRYQEVIDAIRSGRGWYSVPE